MTNYCNIGPISINRGFDWASGVNSPIDGSNEFSIGSIPNYQVLQILGLITPGEKEDFNDKQFLSMDNRGWGPVWIDSSTNIPSNDGIFVEGWHILRDAEEEIINNNEARVRVMADLLSTDPNDYLTMDYSLERILNHNYDDETPYYDIYDEFGEFDDEEVWYPESKYAVVTGSSGIASTGTALQFTGVASALNSYGHVYTQSRETFSSPHIYEFNIEKVTTPAAGRPEANFMAFLSPYRQNGDFLWRSMVYIMMRVTNTAITYEVGIIDASGKNVLIVKKTNTEAVNHRWKVETSTVNSKGYLRVSLDTGSGYVVKWQGETSILSFNNLYFGYLLNTADTTAQQFKSEFCKVHNNARSRDVYPNMVFLPVGCTPTITQTGYRVSSDGNIPYYLNPTEQLDFQVDVSNVANLYKGTVKAYSINNIDDEFRQVTNLNEVLSLADPAEFYITNGLTRLDFGDDFIDFKYWNGTSWATMDTLSIGTNRRAHFKVLNPMRAVVTLNRTEWALKIGRKHFNVLHPYDAVYYTKRNRYYHDGDTTEDPAPDADITMQTQYYCNIYNAVGEVSDTFRMQINKLFTGTIKSDSVPASVLTGFGWYDSTVASESVDSYSNIAKEWMNQTIQKFTYRG